MENAEIIGTVVIALVTLVGLGIAIITPLIKLNGNITKLNSNIEQLKNDEENIEGRVKEHSDAIDKLNIHQVAVDKDIQNHEKRINAIEKRKGGRRE